MTFDANIWAVVASMVASVIIGFLWYGPLFGKKWMELTGIKMPEQKPPVSMMVKPVIISLVGALFASYVLSLGVPADVSTGLLAGLAAWIGFVVPAHLNFVAWEGKPWTLFAINTGYWLALLLVMGALLAGWR